MLVFTISKTGVCLHYETQLTHTKGCKSSKTTLLTPLNLRIACLHDCLLHTESSKQKNNL
jgi:hypothetical protein